MIITGQSFLWFEPLVCQLMRSLLLTCNFNVTCFAFSDLEVTIILSLAFGFPPNLSKPECGPLSSTLFSASFLLCLFQSTRIMYSSLSPLKQEPSRFLPLPPPKWLNLYPEFSRYLITKYFFLWQENIPYKCMTLRYLLLFVWMILSAAIPYFHCLSIPVISKFVPLLDSFPSIFLLNYVTGLLW